VPSLRHEIPTHLNVEDRAIYGLSVRQLTYLVAGCSGAYGLWAEGPDLPDELRGVLAGLCFLAALAFALVRPGGRGLEEWAFAALHHLATPRVALWRVPEPDPARWRSVLSPWAERAPAPTWTEGGP
jgi:hypothetical protein